jgi:hypothetical protein
MNLNFLRDFNEAVLVQPDTLDRTEGEVFIVSCSTWATTITGTPTVASYSSATGGGNGVAVSISGAVTVNGGTISFAVTLPAGKKEYVSNVTFVVSGETFVRYFKVRARAARMIP